MGRTVHLLVLFFVWIVRRSVLISFGPSTSIWLRCSSVSFACSFHLVLFPLTSFHYPSMFFHFPRSLPFPSFWYHAFALSFSIFVLGCLRMYCLPILCCPSICLQRPHWLPVLSLFLFFSFCVQCSSRKSDAIYFYDSMSFRSCPASVSSHAQSLLMCHVFLIHVLHTLFISSRVQSRSKLSLPSMFLPCPFSDFHFTILLCISDSLLYPMFPCPFSALPFRNCIIPQTASSCRGSDGFGQGAGYRDWLLGDWVTGQICYKYRYRIDGTFKN